MVVKRKMWKSFEIKLFSEPFSDWGKPGKSSFNILICNISVSIFPFSSKKTFGKQTKELSWLILFETISKAKEKKRIAGLSKSKNFFNTALEVLRKSLFLSNQHKHHQVEKVGKQQSCLSFQSPQKNLKVFFPEKLFGQASRAEEASVVIISCEELFTALLSQLRT